MYILWWKTPWRVWNLSGKRSKMRRVSQVQPFCSLLFNNQARKSSSVNTKRRFSWSRVTESDESLFSVEQIDSVWCKGTQQLSKITFLDPELQQKIQHFCVTWSLVHCNAIKYNNLSIQLLNKDIHLWRKAQWGVSYLTAFSYLPLGESKPTARIIK